MNRSITFIAAVLCAFVTVSSACASPADGLRFTLEPQRGDPARLHASFREQRDGRNDSNWSTGLTPSELIGLEVSSFRVAGSRPLHFSVVREAGRLDCAGNGGNNFAAGNCRFTGDAGFAQMLATRGIGQPTRDQAFALMAVNAHRAMLDAIASARYPIPRMDDVIALSALGVDGRYIANLASAGYRPQKISSLIEFKALNIDAPWIGSFARAGYANLPADDLVQLRALNIPPDFIAGFRRIGYGNLPVNKLVELKALDITPDFVRSVTPANGAAPPVNELAELKIFGHKH